MRLREFAPSPERDNNDDVPDPIFVLANRWWNATDRQPQIEHVLNSLGWSIHQVESEDDAVQLQHRDGTTHFISADDFDPELFEIARLPKSELGDWGKKGTLADPKTPPKTKPLPGGSKFDYAVNQPDAENIEIMIFDGQILAAEMDLYYTQDYMKTWKVDTVVVDPDFRGQGLGKALYGIALSILKLTVEAGETQTRHGQQMWLMLNSIPGVEVLGYNMTPTDEYRPQRGDQVVDQTADWTRYTFPVKPGSSSMRSGRRGTGIYTSQATMIAKWTGQ
jgi:GNAT superfamily N-acetyltransferase